MNLKDKKVLITGATGGIGNCLVEKFNSMGCSIVATGTNEDKLKDLKNKYSNIYIEKFKLDQHDKIEDFIATIIKEAIHFQISKPEITFAPDAALSPFIYELNDESTKKAFPNMPITSLSNGVNQSLSYFLGLGDS